jgi:hypothetical protein
MTTFGFRKAKKDAVAIGHDKPPRYLKTQKKSAGFPPHLLAHDKMSTHQLHPSIRQSASMVVRVSGREVVAVASAGRKESFTTIPRGITHVQGIFVGFGIAFVHRGTGP